jgi:hypothetical protein
MDRIQAIRELMDAYEVTQRETYGPERGAEDERFRDMALKVLGATDAEIEEAAEGLATYQRPE